MASLPTRRRYKFANAPVVTTLGASMGASDTTFTLVSGTNWPASGATNFWVTIGAGTATEERILCSGTSGTTVTVASSGRGQEGTSAQAHNQGDTVWVSWSATDADEANAHVSASASDANVNVHGLAIGSSVVGTADSQTLTNKTLTAPKISGTSSGTTTIQGSAAASGTITVPAVTGTLVTTGDTGTVTNAMLSSAWTTSTPTAGTGFTVGNGTWLVSRYAQIGKIVHWYGVFSFGSTTSVTGAINFSLPVTGAANIINMPINGSVSLSDAANSYYQGAAEFTSTTNMRLYAVNAAGTYAKYSLTSSTVPFTWNSNSQFYFYVSYEAA